MLFNTFIYFAFFLPLTVIIYFWSSAKLSKSFANGWLVMCSLIFYSWWNIIYLPLLLGSILVNYAFGYISAQNNVETNKKLLLVLAVLFNLGLLAYFKYTDFFIKNINDLITDNAFALPHIILPLGISFFTFTQIAFQVDCYYGKAKECTLLNYTLFVSFFPHLLAGPILHHGEMMPQFKAQTNRVVNYENMLAGLVLFSIGLFKKSVIADSLAGIVNYGFDHPESLKCITAWLTSFAYTFQLYFDFSGYTDMAIASALFFNITFPINFFSPYKASSIQDFWRRWHMTLSRFLRDYLYIPLGGNRVSKVRVGFNLLATFILGGLWHGANWTFVFWGTLHGLALVIQRVWQSFGLKLNSYVAWFITFNFINITWIFFRANSFNDAVIILKRMSNFDRLHFSVYSLAFCAALCACLAFCLLLKNSNQLIAEKVYQRRGCVLMVTSILLVSIFVISYRNSHAFIYFQF